MKKEMRHHLKIKRYLFDVKQKKIAKKWYIGLALLFVFAFAVMAHTVMAQQTTATSGKNTTSAVICNKGCVLSWLNMTADGTNAVTVNVYDGTSTSGTLIDSTYIPTNIYSVKKNYQNTTMKNGMYITVSGTNGAYYVGYIAGY